MGEQRRDESAMYGVPRPASTVVVVRDHERGLQTLLLRRHARSGFAADRWVFPGGAVDSGDRTLATDRWTGVDPDALASRFGDQPPDVLGFHVTAVRETFEESGLLVGGPARLPVRARAAGRAECARAGTAEAFAAWLAREDIRLDLAHLTYLSRWVTPRGQPKRYDACFFLVAVPRGQRAAHDGVELTDSDWVRPAEALERKAAGTMALMPPTEHTLRWLRGYHDARSALSSAAEQSAVVAVHPRMERGPAGWEIVVPSHAPGGSGVLPVPGGHR